MKQKKITLGIIQENPIVGDIEGNLKLAIESIEALYTENGSHDIYLFTEMFITGYPPEDLILREDLLHSAYAAIKELGRLKPESYICLLYTSDAADE